MYASDVDTPIMHSTEVVVFFFTVCCIHCRIVCKYHKHKYNPASRVCISFAECDIMKLNMLYVCCIL